MREKVSIVTVLFNEVEHTIRFVESLRKYTREYELIVIDNCSTDGTCGFLTELASKGEIPIRVYHNDTNLGYVKGINQGIRLAEFSLICIVNNDIVFSPGWLDKLRWGLLTGVKKVKTLTGPVGAVGPTADNVSGMQVVQLNPIPREWNDTTMRSVNAEVRKGNLIETGFLVGFCMLIRREVFDSIGLFDEENFSNGGFDDNDFCLRMLHAGWKMLIVGNCFLHHVGGATIRHFPELKRGTSSRFQFYKKWHNPNPTRVIAAYRVKDGGELFAKSLANVSEFVDGIVVFDDNSTDNTSAVARACPKVLEVKRTSRTTFDERMDRNDALELARMHGAEWILAIDSDELFGPEMTYARMQNLTHPVNPQYLSFGFYWYNFWNSLTHYRTDGIWGQMRGSRLFKVLPNQRIVLGSTQGLHCGNIPYFAPTNVMQTCIRIKHYGYVSPQQRLDKYKFYSNVDQDLRPELVGAENYNHLIHDSDMHIRRWLDTNGISLAIMGKNEADDLTAVLEFMRYLVDEVIYLDTGSSDASLDVARALGARVFEKEWVDDFSEMRNYLISQSTQRWIFHMDPDERMSPVDAFKLRHVIDDTDTVAFFVPLINHHPDGRQTMNENVRIFRNLPIMKYTGRVHETFDLALRQLRNQAPMRMAPFAINHFGYMKPKPRVQEKLDLYERLNMAQYKESPGDPRPCLNLALQRLNDGNIEEGSALLWEALKRDPNYYQAAKELACVNVEQAKGLLRLTVSKLPPNFPLRVWAEKSLAAMDEHFPNRVYAGEPKKYKKRSKNTFAGKSEELKKLVEEVA